MCGHARRLLGPAVWAGLKVCSLRTLLFTAPALSDSSWPVATLLPATCSLILMLLLCLHYHHLFEELRLQSRKSLLRASCRKARLEQSFPEGYYPPISSPAPAMDSAGISAPGPQLQGSIIIIVIIIVVIMMIMLVILFPKKPRLPKKDGKPGKTPSGVGRPPRATICCHSFSFLGSKA